MTVGASGDRQECPRVPDGPDDLPIPILQSENSTSAYDHAETSHISLLPREYDTFFSNVSEKIPRAHSIFSKIGS